MNTRKLLFSCSLMAFALSLPLGCGDDETGTGGAGGEDRIPCERTSDCNDGNSCTFDNCILPEGYCTFRPVSGPDPEAEQTDGDCKEIRCDKDGESVVENDDRDAPDDPDGGDCIEPVCVDGAVVDGNLDAEAGCDFNGGRGVCDGMGVCSCQAPNVQADHYVDPVNGTDDPAFGGASGACAYRTIGYALSQAEGRIELAFGTYDTTQETFPIVLQGERRLECNRDDMDNRATIVGSGDYMGVSATIVAAGASNDVRNCDLDGGGAADVVFYVATLGQGNNPHELRDCDVHGGVDGVVVDSMADEVRVRDSTLRGFTGRAVGVDRLDANVNLDGNTFQNNTVDLVCADASQNVDGQGNQGLGTCQVCQECGNF